MNSVLVVEKARDRVTTVELNRPDRLNAIDFRLRSELADTFESLARDPGVRSVVLQGRGRSFCAGGDIKELASIDRTADEDRDRIAAGNRMIRSICALDIPVVAAVHGPVAGVGIALALAADVVVAAEDTQFHFSFVKVGLAPDGGLSHLLTKRIGAGRARALLISGVAVGAREAAQIGIVDHLIDPRSLSDRAQRLAGELGSRSLPALRGIKGLLVDREALEDAMSRELEQQTSLLETKEHKDALAGFLARTTTTTEGSR